VVDLSRELAKENQGYAGEIFMFDAPRGKKPKNGDAETVWIAGGEFTEPFDARHFAWRQYRKLESLRDPSAADEVHAYLPDQRRVRRVPVANVDGLYVPTFSVGAGPRQELAVATGGSASGAGVQSAGAGASPGSVTPDSGLSAAAQTGFEGLAFRPNRSTWRLVGTADVLAPINVAQPMYPAVSDRNFGPSGLSLADRWDLRRAIVLESRAKPEKGQALAPSAARTVHYFDLQTLVPLYTIAYDADGGAPDVIIHASRWSESRKDYPRWPDDAARPVRVLDPVAAVFASDAGRSWRRESWDFVATPPSAAEVERLQSVASLERGH
jgi:hypothetical protein